MALQVAERVAGELAGHMALDTERFDNLRSDVTELKGEVRRLNDDAKEAIDEVRKQQADNHKENSEKLAELIHKQAGANGAWAMAAKWLPILFAAATLAIVWLRP